MSAHNLVLHCEAKVQVTLLVTDKAIGIKEVNKLCINTVCVEDA